MFIFGLDRLCTIRSPIDYIHYHEEEALIWLDFMDVITTIDSVF